MHDTSKGKWAHRLHTDSSNRIFIQHFYPWFLPVYDAYPEHIMRVDAFRYFMLYHFGGVYIDMDFECLRPLDPLLSGRTLLLGEEPVSHVRNIKRKNKELSYRLPRTIVCNAFMASVPKHPFWECVFSLLLERSFEKDTLYATGPLMLSEAWQRFEDKPEGAVLPAVQLYPISAEEALLADTEKLLAQRIADSEHTVYAVHHWMGSWIRDGVVKRQLERLIRCTRRSSSVVLHAGFRIVYICLRAIKSFVNRLRVKRTRIELPAASVPSRPLHKKELQQEILVAVPVKNAESFLPTFFSSLARISYPHKHLHLAFLESDSRDDTWDWLNTHAAVLRREYGSLQLYREHFMFEPQYARYRTQDQLMRRSILARSRNHLLKRALGAQSWVLWIDADIEWFPPEVLECLLAEDKEIIVPNCLTPYGDCFDLNSFKFSGDVDDEGWNQYIVDGLIQPPAGVGRRYLNDFTEMSCVPLDSVGGTMLLVKADVHRSGVVFPERPYRHYIETEGFAMHAIDKGFGVWGMPKLSIIHPLH